MITRVEIENWKAIRKVAIDLGPMTVLVGPNDAGKSTILQALEFLGRAAQRAAADFSPWFDDPQKIIRDGDRDATLRIAVDGSTQADEYRFEATWGFVDGRFQLRGSRVESGGGAFSGIFPNELVFTVGHFPPIVRVIADDLAAFSVRFDPHNLVIPAAADDAFQSDGFGLASVIDALLTDIDRTGRDAFEATLRRFSKHVTAIGTRPAAAEPQVLGVSLPSKSRKEITFGMPGNRVVPASHASSGLLLAAAYIALRHTGYRRFLIDEPENGVHPRALLQIIDVLRELAKDGRQVVMTTHSPVLLSYIDPADIRVVTRDAASGVKVTPALESAAFKDRTQTLDAGELWYALGDEEIAASAS